MWIVFCGNWKDRDDRISIVLPLVVDLAVENDPAVTVITGHGLLTSRREINDAQPVMA